MLLPSGSFLSLGEFPPIHALICPQLRAPMEPSAVLVSSSLVLWFENSSLPSFSSSALFLHKFWLQGTPSVVPSWTTARVLPLGNKWRHSQSPPYLLPVSQRSLSCAVRRLISEIFYFTYFVYYFKMFNMEWLFWSLLFYHI